ncbi:MAG: hypothetical protein QME78_15355, partial [Thermodesulfobacteriota bacterium]|nr:hypothetical protein [Thermodesulfobacteriota bacterium]
AFPKVLNRVSAKCGGVFFSAPSMKKPAPHAAKRSALNPGPGKDHPAPVNNESFVTTKSEGRQDDLTLSGMFCRIIRYY